MKRLWDIAIGALFTLLATGLLLWIARTPGGQPVSLQPPPTAAPLVVHVAGAVAQPGVYHLPQGSRVQDAIQSAGGLLPAGDDRNLNLAAFLADSQRLEIPFKPPTPAPTATRAPAPAQADPAAPGAPTEPPAASPASAPNGPIDINTATLEELDTLPGIGPTIAQRIIDYRNANGPFKTIDDLLNVDGIGPTTFEKIKPLITVNALP